MQKNACEGGAVLFKICVVGCGGIANGAHLPAIQKYMSLHPDVVLVACADVNEKRAYEAKEKFNIPRAYTSIDLMLAVEHPNAVICLVQEEFVSQVSCDILRKGYPVMLEKPPGKTLAEVRAITEISQSSGAPHMVAFNRRFSPHLLRLKQQIADQEIVSIDYTMERVNRTEDYFEYTVIHAVDAVLFLAQCKAQQVEIRYQEMPHLGDKVANYFLYFTFDPSEQQRGKAAKPFTATIRIYPTTGHITERAAVYTADGVWQAQLPLQGVHCAEDLGFVKHFTGQSVCETTEGAHFTEQNHHTANGFYGELAYFIDCVQSGTKPAHTADTCYQSVLVADLMKHRIKKYLFEL